MSGGGPGRPASGYPAREPNGATHRGHSFFRSAGTGEAGVVLSERPLRAIALEMGTDKQGAHAYADEDETHFAHLRHRPIRLLEIGVGGYAEPDLWGEAPWGGEGVFSPPGIVGMD